MNIQFTMINFDPHNTAYPNKSEMEEEDEDEFSDDEYEDDEEYEMGDEITDSSWKVRR